MAKLTIEQANEIRAKYKAGGYTNKSLGAEYGVSAMLVSQIMNYKVHDDRAESSKKIQKLVKAVPESQGVCIKDRAKYVLPLDEHGELRYPKFENDYKKMIDKYIASLDLDEDEKEMKKLYFKLNFVKKLVDFSTPDLVDKYSNQMQAMKDLYLISTKSQFRNDDLAIFKMYQFTDENISLAIENRKAFQEVVNLFGYVWDISNYANSSMSKTTYDAICYMRDHGFDYVWCAYFLDYTDKITRIQHIYSGAKYAFYEEKDVVTDMYQ